MPAPSASKDGSEQIQQRDMLKKLYSLTRFKTDPLLWRDLLISGGIICLAPWLSPPVALMLGFIYALVIGNTHLALTHKIIKVLLQTSVVALGFGMNLKQVLVTGGNGFWMTLVTITGTLCLGSLLAMLVRVPRKTGFMISSGTAICGGSAIAALSPALSATPLETSIALGVIFSLNSIALFIFPVIGAFFGLTQKEFGLWAALAIHDTSSVVGAAKAYGNEALMTATAMKLTRTLWIAPLVCVASALSGRKKFNFQVPPFIGLFLLASACKTFLPVPALYYEYLVSLGKIGLVVTLYLIGTSLSLREIGQAGCRPFIQGILLWIFVATASLALVQHSPF